MLTQQQLDGAIAFHGHCCPGLAFGIRAGEWAVREFGHAEDEEIVAVVENDSCAVDAIQYLTGCTFGKGNFVFLDYGKMAFSFFRRSDGKAARLVAKHDLLADLREQESLRDEEREPSGEKDSTLVPHPSPLVPDLRQQMIDRVLQSDFDAVFSACPVQITMPEKAKIHKSIPCDACGEMTMGTRILCDSELTGGRNLCIPCRE